jgi:hypothetical protein
VRHEKQPVKGWRADFRSKSKMTNLSCDTPLVPGLCRSLIAFFNNLVLFPAAPQRTRLSQYALRGFQTFLRFQSNARRSAEYRPDKQGFVSRFFALTQLLNPKLSKSAIGDSWTDHGLMGNGYVFLLSFLIWRAIHATSISEGII